MAEKRVGQVRRCVPGHVHRGSKALRNARKEIYMSAPYQIAVINDLAIGETVESLLLGRPGFTLNEPSRVRVYATRETALVLMGLIIGQAIVMPNGSPANISAVVGSLPSIQDDLWAEGLGVAGDDIIIQAVNNDPAAAEARVLVKVVALDDLETGLIL